MGKENRRIAAIGAHPDDIEFMCSGTLKLLRDAGFELHMGVLANGDCGSMVETQEAITKIRRQEALHAAALLGAEFHPMGEQDLRIEFDERTRMLVTEYIRVVNPFIVFTHPRQALITGPKGNVICNNENDAACVSITELDLSEVDGIRGRAAGHLRDRRIDLYQLDIPSPRADTENG